MPQARRFWSILTIVALLLSMVAAPVAANDPIDPNKLQKAAVTIDGVKLDADAYIVNGRTVVPLRAIFERLNSVVDWDADTWTVTATRGTRIIKLTINQTTAYVDGKPVELAVPAMLINSRTFVPLRFVSEALDSEVGWDPDTWTAIVNSGLACNIPGGQVHSGTIKPGGETWGLCGSPHIVRGEFAVEGLDSPILTIAPGVLVQFEADANISVGREAPGGLQINGKQGSPVNLTAAIAGAQPGHWSGIQFYNQTLRGNATIEHARISHAGGPYGYSSAIFVEGGDKLTEIQLKNVEIANSLHAGLYLGKGATLSVTSDDLSITGTKMADGAGGFPIITALYGTHNLPSGTYRDNAINAVNISSQNWSEVLGRNTTWRNIGIPYAVGQTIEVYGNASPTLTIEPGVITLWKQGHSLEIGREGPGTLIADARMDGRGGGEWLTANLESAYRSVLESGLKVADASSLEPGCALCGPNKAIVFGAWAADPSPGSWEGIKFYEGAGAKSVLAGTVVAHAGGRHDLSAGIYAEAATKVVKFQLFKSLVFGSEGSGVLLHQSAEFAPGTTGNIVTKNTVPMRLQPEALGTLESGNNLTGNGQDWISVWTGNWESDVTKSATWRDQGVPYYFESGIIVAGSARPVVTVEAGVKLIFTQEKGITIGSDGTGSLKAVGTAAKPVIFTSEMGRPGTWQGLYFTGKAGAENRLEYVTVEYAGNGVTVDADLGGFIKNAMIRFSAENGIIRNWDLEKGGTDFLVGFGNLFEGNGLDQNE